MSPRRFVDCLAEVKAEIAFFDDTDTTGERVGVGCCNTIEVRVGAERGALILLPVKSAHAQTGGLPIGGAGAPGAAPRLTLSIANALRAASALNLPALSAFNAMKVINSAIIMTPLIRPISAATEVKNTPPPPATLSSLFAVVPDDKA